MSGRSGAVAKGSWESTFPSQQETAQDSTQFMKRLIYLGFSQVILARQLLPMRSFKKRTLERMRLYVFDTNDEDAQMTGGILRSAIEALEHGYLRELHLVIGDEEEADRAVEVYKMGVVYEGDKPSLKVFYQTMDTISIDYHGAEFVREQTRSFLIRLRKMADCLQPLPNTANFYFYIVYDDEKTPKGYQASSFQRRPDSYTLCPDTQEVAVGGVHTKYHACHCALRSKYINDAVEFETRVDGEFGDIERALRSRDVSLDLDSSTESALLTPRKMPERHDPINEKKAITPVSNNVNELEKAASDLKITENISSPEEEVKKKQSQGKSSSPKKSSQGKVHKRTPGMSNPKKREHRELDNGKRSRA